MKHLKNIKKLPPIEDIINEFPLSEAAEARVEENRTEIKDILAGRDDRLMMIVGPCSAWPSPAVLEFAKRLAVLADEVKDSIKLVMRVYIQKPRTTIGWTGPVNQSDPFSEPDIEAGARYTREMFVNVAELGLPIADEAVFTHNAKGFIELLSWIAIGARSTEDQEHRIFASAIEPAVGMKNPTSGSLQIGVNSVIAAQHGHTAVFDGHQVQTEGNEYAHLVLRGGANGPNFHLDKLYRATEHLDEAGVKNPAIIIDASHENCRMNGEKDPAMQMDVIREVMHNLRNHPELRRTVKGFMLESFIKTGSQSLKKVTADDIDKSGLSITDPCLGWEDTEALIRDTADLYQKLSHESA